MRISNIHGLLAVVLLLAGCGAKTPEEHIQSARAALQASDLKSAEIELKSALQDMPDNAEARLLLAQTLQATGRWDDSEKELRKAQDRGASPEQTLPMLAVALLKMGKYQEATELPVPISGMGSQALASLQAERANAFMALGKLSEAAQTLAEGEQVLLNTGNQADFSSDLQLAKARLALANKQPDEAMSILDKALERDGKLVEAMYLKAQLLDTSGKAAEALKVYERITSTKPNEILAYLAIADSKLQTRDLKGAEQSLQAAERINANLPLFKHTRAKLALIRGDLQAANADLQQVLRVAPNHLPSVMLDATVSFGLGNYEQSLKSANKVLGQVPGHLASARLAAANALKLGNIQAAMDTLLPLVTAHPDDAQLLSLIGEAYLQAKQYDKAMSYLDRAAALQPNNPAIRTSQAEGYLAQGKSDLALRELEQVARMSDDASTAELTLVMLHLSRHEYDTALRAIAALEKKMPNNPVTSNLKGGAYLGKGDSASARKAFEQALAHRPAYFPAAANLARLDLAAKKPDAARARYEAVLKADAKSVPAMVALAELAAARNQKSDSVLWLEKAARADPKAIQPRAGLIRHHLGNQSPQKALAIAREAVSANPDSPEALRLLGSVQMAAGDRPSALSTLTKMAEKAPNSADAFQQLGMAQLSSERANDARASLERALTIQPDHVGALDGLLYLDALEKKLDRALQRVRAFQAKNPKSAVGFTREGDILLGQKQFLKAAAAYEKGLSQGLDLKVFAKMQSALSQGGNQKLADRKLAELLTRYPKDADIQAYAAEYNMLTGRFSDALRLYENMLSVQPDNPATLNNLAFVYQRLGDARALATAEKAHKLAPQVADIMDTLGWILVEQGNLPRAVDVLAQAAGKAPHKASIRYHHGVALARSGKRAEARKELEAAISSGQKFSGLDEAKALLKKL